MAYSLFSKSYRQICSEIGSVMYVEWLFLKPNW